MTKVYCIIYDYGGYEERLEGIYETKDKAIEKLTSEMLCFGYDNIRDFMSRDDKYLVEWELDANKGQIISPISFITNECD